ncbi:MAG: hypothetical protein AB1473_23395 [Thermodesulfobacteriota bacterium]
MSKIQRYVFVIGLAFVIAAWCFQAASAAERAKVKSQVFQVPTDGKILDVIYSSEFDEWWVKCREGENIAVYSLDQRSGKWAKVLFTAKKPPEEGKEAEAKKPEVRPDPDAERKAPAASPKEQKPAKPTEPSAEKPKTEAVQPTKAPDKPETSRWWDPFDLVGKGQKIFFPPLREEQTK